MAEPEKFEKNKKKSLMQKFDKLTEGPLGYVVYAALGVLIAFLLNQGLAYALNTDLPVVAVVSGSMDHGINENGPPCGRYVANYTETFDNWWNICSDYYSSINISEQTFKTFPYSDGFKKGDMPIVQKSSSYNVGDVVVYTVPGQSVPIIHRIVKINADGSFNTKGDHNDKPIVFPNTNYSEYSIQPSWVHGRVIFIIPKLGYFKVILTDILSGGRV